MALPPASTKIASYSPPVSNTREALPRSSLMHHDEVAALRNRHFWYVHDKPRLSCDKSLSTPKRQRYPIPNEAARDT